MLSEESAFLQRIEGIAEKDGRYKHEAYLFVYAALEYTAQKLKRDRAPSAQERHVTGQELALGIAEYARSQFGAMARPVFEFWGLRSTLDFGRIVFNLVDAGMMSKTGEDRLEDFQDVYDFGEAFDPKRVQDTLARLDLKRL